MPGSVDRSPSLIEDLRKLKARIAELELSNSGHANSAPWQTPTLANGFTDLGGDYAPTGYYIDTLGLVRLRGGLNHGSGITSDTTIFTLAVGYRPAYEHVFLVAADSAGGDATQWVTVNTDGTVVANQAGDEGGRMWLDAVQFRVV